MQLKYKRMMCLICRPEYFFKKKSRNQVDETIDQLYVSKSFLKGSFNLKSCQEIVKEDVLTDN